MSRTDAFLVLVVCVIIAGSLPAAWGSVSLKAYLVPEITESRFEATYQKTTAIIHGDDDGILEILPETDGTIRVEARDGDPDAEALKAVLNENIRASGSSASIRSLDVSYETVPLRYGKVVEITYEAKINGTIT